MTRLVKYSNLPRYIHTYVLHTARHRLVTIVTGGHFANHGRLGSACGATLVAHHSGLRASGAWVNEGTLGKGMEMWWFYCDSVIHVVLKQRALRWFDQQTTLFEHDCNNKHGDFTWFKQTTEDLAKNTLG